jgi:hypothetical protein
MPRIGGGGREGIPVARGCHVMIGSPLRILTVTSWFYVTLRPDLRELCRQRASLEWTQGQVTASL